MPASTTRSLLRIGCNLTSRYLEAIQGMLRLLVLLWAVAVISSTKLPMEGVSTRLFSKTPFPSLPTFSDSTGTIIGSLRIHKMRSLSQLVALRLVPTVTRKIRNPFSNFSSQWMCKSSPTRVPISLSPNRLESVHSYHVTRPYLATTPAPESQWFEPTHIPFVK